MTSLPEFFTTQHQLRELAIVDQGAGSTLFLVENPSKEQLLVEIFSLENRGVLREAGVAGRLQHSAIAPIIGTGTMNNGQEFFVRRCLAGEQLSRYTGSGTGAHHLSRDEALAVFAPLAEAVDFLLQQGRADYALRALNPRRIILTGNRSNAFLATVGPDGSSSTARPSAQEVVTRLAQLLTAAYPTFRADSTYPTAAALISALRSHNPRNAAAAPQAQQRQEPQQQPPRQKAPQTAPQPAVHPTQHYPEQQSQYSPQEQAQPEAPQKKSSKGLLLGLGAGAAAIAVAGGLAWFFLGREAWSEQEQVLADSHPDLISARPGGSGFDGAKCDSREPEDGQTAKITCVGEQATFSVASYADADERESAGPTQDGQELSNGRCTVLSYDLSEGGDPLYYMANEDSSEAVLVWGENAENTRLRLPIC